MTALPPRRLRFAATDIGPLAQNSKHEFAAKRALCHFRSGAVYSMIPKNACSTMRLSLALANGCIRNAGEHDWIHRNNETFRADLRGLVTAPFTFAIFRCPFARLASAFLDKVVTRQPAAASLTCPDEADFDPAQISFNEFVARIASAGLESANAHWRPQVDFLVYDRYDEIFSFEAFQTVIDGLRAKIALDVIDARQVMNSGLQQFRPIEEGDWSQVSAQTIAGRQQQGESPVPRTLYTPELVAQVRALYADDLAFYNRHLGSQDLMFS